MLRFSDATMFNLGLLTSDMYTLLFGLLLFHYTVRDDVIDTPMMQSMQHDVFNPT